jgi:branched-chain amino acid transport system permease protein
MIIQVILNSLVLGLTYVLMASGLTLVFGIMRIVNFTHGQMYMFGSFILFYLSEIGGLGYFPSFVLSCAAIALLGVVIEKGLIRPFMKGPPVPLLTVILGGLVFLEGAASLIFGELDKTVQAPFTGIVRLGPATLPVERIVVMLTAMVIIFILYWFIFRTKEGTAIRAVAQERYAATLQGISINRCSMLVMAIGSALAAAAGSILAPLFMVNPYIGGTALFKALIIITLGGMGSITGCALGGLILGFIEGFGYAYLGVWTEIIGFILVIMILLIRPQGLLGLPYEIAH